MSFMQSFESGMERVLVPIANKLNSQRHIAAIRDAFILVFPLIMAGSIIILINFAVLSGDGFIAKILFLNKLFPNLSAAQAIFAPVLQGSINIMAILIAFLVARNLAVLAKQDDLLAGLTSIGAFFILYTPNINIEGQGSFLTPEYLGAKGLFVAVMVGILVGELFSKLAASPKLMIKMPDQVPPAVARSFKILLPVIIIMVVVSVINYLISQVADGGINGLVYSLIQAPMKDLATNVYTVVLLGVISNMLWVLGIHGPNTIAAIRDTMFSEANLANLSWVAEQGTAWGAPYPATWAINDAFGNYGGSGMTLGLLLAIFIASRRQDYKDIAKLSFAPGLFNINEPVIFGLPIVLNPILIIPFILTPAVNTIIGYIFISTELIPPIAYAVPWTTPGPLIAFFGTGGNWLALAVGFLCLGVATLIYLPFVIVGNKVAQNELAKNK